MKIDENQRKLPEIAEIQKSEKTQKSQKSAFWIQIMQSGGSFERQTSLSFQRELSNAP